MRTSLADSEGISAPERGLHGRDRFLVPASFLLSCLANDGEEWVTMARSMQATAARMPEWLPTRRFLTHGVPQQHVRVSISVMGALYAAAAVDGYRSRGRGRLFQDVQRVFGLHGFGHIMASVVTQGYTTGVVTAPTVVIPQGRWAKRKLELAGVPDSSNLPRAVAVVLTTLVVAHLAGARVAGEI